jgi:hypothetical protein
VNIDQIKIAVEDAGFSVGSLKLTGNFNDLKIEDDGHVLIGNKNFHFLNLKNQVVSGEKTITIVDKDFLTEKSFKKIYSSSKFSCLLSGKTDSCCVKEGLPSDSRIFHVTL